MGKQNVFEKSVQAISQLLLSANMDGLSQQSKVSQDGERLELFHFKEVSANIKPPNLFIISWRVRKHGFWKLLKNS